MSNLKNFYSQKQPDHRSAWCLCVTDNLCVITPCKTESYLYNLSGLEFWEDFIAAETVWETKQKGQIRVRGGKTSLDLPPAARGLPAAGCRRAEAAASGWTLWYQVHRSAEVQR